MIHHEFALAHRSGNPETEASFEPNLLRSVARHPAFWMPAGIWILVAVGAWAGFLAGGIWGAVTSAVITLAVGAGGLGWILSRRFAEVSNAPDRNVRRTAALPQS